MHYEELWVKAEELKAGDISNRSVKSIIMELQAKFSVYEAMDANDKLSPEEKQRLKEHLFGKLLMTLTQLSLKDNVNTYAALAEAIEEEQLTQLETKYRS
jgi:hypothetical protein